MANEAFAAIGYSDEKVATVLNRTDALGGFSREDLEATLGKRVEFEVVSDGRLVLAANNEGVPFVLSSPDAPISQGVRRIASVLVEIQTARTPALAGRH
jgi:Flp pilus assembly CpaE family ATPase